VVTHAGKHVLAAVAHVASGAMPSLLACSLDAACIHMWFPCKVPKKLHMCTLAGIALVMGMHALAQLSAMHSTMAWLNATSRNCKACSSRVHGYCSELHAFARNS
jgi:hypothetical protein